MTRPLLCLATSLLLLSCKGVDLKPACARLHRIAFDGRALAAEGKIAARSTSESAAIIGSGRIDVARVYLHAAFDSPVIRMINAAGRDDSYVNECWAAGIDEMARAFLTNYFVHEMRDDPIGSNDPRYRIESEIIDIGADESKARMLLSATLTTFRGKRDTLVWSGVVRGEAPLGGGDARYLNVPHAYELALADIGKELLLRIRQQDAALRAR